MPTEKTASELVHAKTVRDMFSGIAGKYDFLNHFLSLNIDKSWRRRVRQKLSDELADPNKVILDVACGTGDLSIELRQNGKAKIIGTDFCRPMLDVAAEKNKKNGLTIPYLEGDAMSLPFADNKFDAVTIGFGLRNVANWEACLREMRRVVVPGGKLVVLEFSSPEVAGFKQAYNFYFSRMLPLVGGIFSGSRAAYEYLPDSVSRFPDQQKLVTMMRETGFKDVTYQNLTGGIAAIHCGTKE